MSRIPLSFRIIAFSWLLFLISLFLPATNVVETGGTEPGTPLTGWQASVNSVMLSVWLLIVGLAEPRAFLLLIFPFSNSLMLVSPILAYFSAGESIVYAMIFGIAGIIPWLLPADLTGDLFVGFYCWNCANFLMAMGFGMLARDCYRAAFE